MSLQDQLYLLSVPVPAEKIAEWNARYHFELAEGASFLDVLRVMCETGTKKERRKKNETKNDA